MGDIKKPLREFWTPLEVSRNHLLVTPPSHFIPQKVIGFVVGWFATCGKDISNAIPIEKFVKEYFAIDEKI